jgi:hypothetical protein
MRHQRIVWLHDLATEPVVLYSEIDDQEWEVRKVDEFRDGRLAWADADHENDATGTRLGTEPVPPLAEILADPEFQGGEIGLADFEAIWGRAVASSTSPNIARR